MATSDLSQAAKEVRDEAAQEPLTVKKPRTFRSVGSAEEKPATIKTWNAVGTWELMKTADKEPWDTQIVFVPDPKDEHLIPTVVRKVTHAAYSHPFAHVTLLLC